MSVPSPQSDLPRNGIGTLLSGGSDLWDEGLTGEIITSDYFDSQSPTNQFWIKISGTWKEAITWIKVLGIWKQATPKIKVAGMWQ
jgi:hypothetical protein